MTRPPPSAPGGPEAALMPDPGPDEVLQQLLLFLQLSEDHGATVSGGSYPTNVDL